jgi:hypothetical protein
MDKDCCIAESISGDSPFGTGIDCREGRRLPEGGMMIVTLNVGGGAFPLLNASAVGFF